MTDEGLIPEAKRRELAKLVGASSLDMLHPFLARTNYRNESGSLASMIDNNHASKHINVASLTHNINQLKSRLLGDENRTVRDFSEAEVVAFLTEFTAGLQFAYEKAPWDIDADIAFQISTPINPHEPRAAVSFTPGNPDENKKDSLMLELDHLFLLLHLLKWNRDKVFFESYRDDWPAKAQSVLVGVEEGRHLSQYLNSELHDRISDEVEATYGANKPEVTPTEDYETDPLEVDATRFINFHNEEILDIAKDLQKHKDCIRP